VGFLEGAYRGLKGGLRGRSSELESQQELRSALRSALDNRPPGGLSQRADTAATTTNFHQPDIESHSQNITSADILNNTTSVVEVGNHEYQSWHRTKQVIRTLLKGEIPYFAFYIVASELQFKWNHLDGINAVNTTGQIIPLALGTFSLIRALFIIFVA
jgi:hypothetical protein